MSADHRKPVVAFVMLALAAAVVVGVQQAEAQSGRLLAAAIGTDARVQGTLPVASDTVEGREFEQIAALGPAFTSLHGAVGHSATEDVVQPLKLVVGTPEPAPAPVTATPQRRAGASAETSPTSASRQPSRSGQPGPKAAKKAVHKPAGKSARPGGGKRSTGPGAKASGPTQESSVPARRFTARRSHGTSSWSSASAPAKSAAWRDGHRGKAWKAGVKRAGKAVKRGNGRSGRG